MSGGYDLYHFNGYLWRKVIESSDSIYGVWGSAENDVYASGDWGDVFHYNGTGWTQIDCTSELVGDTLFNIWGSSAGDIFAVGDEGAILHYFVAPPTAPLVSTGVATDISTDAAILNGTLNSMGSCGLVNVSFQYGTASGLYIAETIAQPKILAGPFQAVIETGSGFSNQTVYFRAKAACAAGTAYGTESSFPAGTHSFMGLQSHSGTVNSMPPTQPVPVEIANVSVQVASLSPVRVGPGKPVTVNAVVANTGSADGSARIKLYVNGEEQDSRGVAVGAGRTVPVTFSYRQKQPGTYYVYVANISAGSFTVEEMVDPDLILYLSSALILIALILGVFYITARKNRRPV